MQRRVDVRKVDDRDSNKVARVAELSVAAVVPILGAFLGTMRLIAKKTIVNFYTVHSTAKGSLEAFAEEVKAANWEKPSDVIEAYPSADVITGKRFVFNIKGNSYRLVADIEFRLSQMYIVWIGTHAEYNRIDVKTISYVKSD